MSCKSSLIICMNLLLIALLSSPVFAAYPQSQFTIGSTTAIINGAPVNMESAPYIKDGRCFIPLAYAAQALGVISGNVNWDPDSQTITMINDDNVFQLRVGSSVIMFGCGQVVMDVSPEINNGPVCLPIGLLAKAFDYTTSWDSSTQTVTVSEARPHR